MQKEIIFILNQEKIRTSSPAGMAALDYLRKIKNLTGVKEGCREGDCGACVVLLGELKEKHVHYRPVPSCMLPLGELHGKHVVTIEGLNMEQLTPIQEAIVEEGATQCGFCTPGIVLSFTGYLLQEGVQANLEGIQKVLSGHLCRCTGYNSLKKAGANFLKKFTHSVSTLENTNNVTLLIQAGFIPKYFETIPSRLETIPSYSLSLEEKVDYWIAGGTDLYIQKQEELPYASIGALNLSPQMKGIHQEKEYIHIGSLTTFEEFGKHPIIQKIIPNISEYLSWMASFQIRNRATLGGNIINASPVADMVCLLLALDANLKFQQSKETRMVPLSTFYQGYKKIDKKEQELLTEITFPVPLPNTQINFEKVAKRQHLDIASVNSAIKVRVEKNTICEISLAVGGVAPTPLLLKQTAHFLTNKEVSKEVLQQSLEIAQTEFTPISDIRGSAEYRRLLVRQLLIAHFLTVFPKYIQFKDLIA